MRNYIHEWIFHEMAKDFNIIKIKYDFINLSINGESKGLYVIEEGFGKELLERKLRGYISYVRGEDPFSFPNAI